MTMNTNEPQHQMRAVDEIADAPDIDQLVIGADRRDSHLARRRVLMVLVCGAVAVICGVGVASTLARDNGNGSSPVRPTISSTADQGGRDLNDPTSSGATTRTQAEILKLIEAKLPADLKVTAHHGVGESSVIAMAISDSQGYTWVDARVGTTGEDVWDPCRAVRSCSIQRVKDGTLYTLQEVETGGNSTNYSASYTYERPDGRYVYFVQSNVFDPAGRRSSLPLSDEQVRDMLIAPEWDALVADCRPDPGPNC
jgi:hypothetical protein